MGGILEHNERSHGQRAGKSDRRQRMVLVTPWKHSTTINHRSPHQPSVVAGVGGRVYTIEHAFLLHLVCTLQPVQFDFKRFGRFSSV